MCPLVLTNVQLALEVYNQALSCIKILQKKLGSKAMWFYNHLQDIWNHYVTKTANRLTNEGEVTIPPLFTVSSFTKISAEPSIFNLAESLSFLLQQTINHGLFEFNFVSTIEWNENINISKLNINPKPTSFQVWLPLKQLINNGKLEKLGCGKCQSFIKKNNHRLNKLTWIAFTILKLVRGGALLSESTRDFWSKWQTFGKYIRSFNRSGREVINHWW